MAALTVYDVPGNVRELEHLLERAYALGVRGEVSLADLPALSARTASLVTADDLPTIAEMERELILRALRLHGNDKEQAAKALGLSRRTLYRRLKEYGLL
jgi:transcriptional regulator of acetoin/glycerol metabolism